MVVVEQRHVFIGGDRGAMMKRFALCCTAVWFGLEGCRYPVDVTRCDPGACPAGSRCVAGFCTADGLAPDAGVDAGVDGGTDGGADAGATTCALRPLYPHIDGGPGLVTCAGGCFVRDGTIRVEVPDAGFTLWLSDGGRLASTSTCDGGCCLLEASASSFSMAGERAQVAVGVGDQPLALLEVTRRRHVLTGDGTVLGVAAHANGELVVAFNFNDVLVIHNHSPRGELRERATYPQKGFGPPLIDPASARAYVRVSDGVVAFPPDSGRITTPRAALDDDSLLALAEGGAVVSSTPGGLYIGDLRVDAGNLVDGGGAPVRPSNAGAVLVAGGSVFAFYTSNQPPPAFRLQRCTLSGACTGFGGGSIYEEHLMAASAMTLGEQNSASFGMRLLGGDGTELGSGNVAPGEPGPSPFHVLMTTAQRVTGISRHALDASVPVQPDQLAELQVGGQIIYQPATRRVRIAGAFIAERMPPAPVQIIWYVDGVLEELGPGGGVRTEPLPPGHTALSTATLTCSRAESDGGTTSVVYLPSNGDAGWSVSALILDVRGPRETSPWPMWGHDPANTRRLETPLAPYVCP
ncbi:MAG: hypothetical protein JNK82_16120 [Myxococcaceae bacterium]|nr:hypothetical protein [Myxococcaceae bacterium]